MNTSQLSDQTIATLYRINFLWRSKCNGLKLVAVNLKTVTGVRTFYSIEDISTGECLIQSPDASHVIASVRNFGRPKKQSSSDSHLSQTHEELFTFFSSMILDTLTARMNDIESTINRQQKYIAQHGEANDLNPDFIWQDYKIESNDNLLVWDAMKQARDYLK